MLDMKNEMSTSIIKFIKIQKKKIHVCSVLFIVCLYVRVCECLLPNNNHKTKHKIILIVGVSKSQAAPVYLITAHHLCAFLMYLAR